MNLAFLASIAWFVWNPKNEVEPIILAKDKLINRGIYIIQNEADSNVLMANGGDEVDQKIGNVTVEKWQRITKTSWLIKTADNYPGTKGIYTMTPTDNAFNQISLVFHNNVAPLRFTKHYWNIVYAGHSFGDDKWLLQDFGSDGTFQGKCLENNGHKKLLVFRACNSTLSEQRWKFCLCTAPKELGS